MSPRVGLDIDIIVQTAGRLADEHGWEEVTLARLAKTLGVRSPSLYNHVNGLSELRHHMAIYALRKLYEEFERATDAHSDEEAIRALCYAYLRFTRSHPGLYEATVRAPDLEQVDLIQLSDQIVKLLIHLMMPFVPDENEAVHAVRGLRSLLHGFSSLGQKGGFGLPVNLDETFSRLIDIYLAGLRSSNYYR